MAGKGGGLRFEGQATTDGTGAATVDMVLPAASSKARSGWRVLRAVIGNAGAAPLTGGTVTLRDNAGAGTTFMTFTQSSDGTKRELAAPTAAVTGNLRLTCATGGASKTFQYLVEVG